MRFEAQRGAAGSELAAPSGKTLRIGRRRRWGAALTVASLVGVGIGATTVTGASAAANCNTGLAGWAAASGSGLSTTTGGGNASVQTVTNLADLTRYAADSTARVLRISGTINTGSSPVEIASNKTIIGADRNARIVGGVNIGSGKSNIIVRNLTIKGAGYGNSPVDTAAARGSHHLWFDHLDLSDAGDGLLDLTRGSDFITVSWVKFSYTTGQPHRFASLVSGGADHDDTDLGKQNATFHHNWFADRVDQRMPRMLYGKGHVYNNYYTATGNSYAVGVGSLASVLIENNYFKGVKNPHQFMYDRPHYITARGNVYDGTTGTQNTGAGGSGGGVTPFTNPPYSYTADPASAVPALVSACAGPTLDSSGTSTPTATSTPTPTPTTTKPTATSTPTLTPTPTRPTMPPTATMTNTATSTTSAPAGACSATYRTVGSWSGGFQGEVTVKAGSAAIRSWTVRWTLGSGQAIAQLWSGVLSTSGSAVTVKNETYNGSVAASGTTVFGFTGSGTASTPTLTCGA